MGELSSWDAESKKNYYRRILEKAKKNVRENFEEMDFENANKRSDMENIIEEIEEACQAKMNELDGMGFE